MTASELVRTRLLALPDVTAICAQRIYLVAFPQNFAASGIRVERISDRPTTHVRGSGGPWTDRVQCDIVAPSLADAYRIDLAAYGNGGGSALAGFTGFVAGARVWSIVPDTVREMYDATETRLFRLMREYFVSFSEVRP